MAKQPEKPLAHFGTPVPDVFADTAVMFDMANGTVRISFGVVTPADPTAPSAMAMATIGRLILPTAGAQSLCLGLYDYLKKHGLDPLDAVTGDDKAN